jgi:hypothetical protein
MKIFTFMISMCLSVLLHAQQTSCESLIEYVEENGSKKGSVGAMQLLQSTWLINVDAYTINNTLVVIAEIKKDSYGFSTKQYIFCGIPESNWEYFSGFYSLTSTYGERFQKYIIEYQCDCY